MNFPDALSAIFNDDKRVRRAFWSTRVIVGLEDSLLCIKGFSSSGPDDGKWHPWTITESDFYADDWEILDG